MIIRHDIDPVCYLKDGKQFPAIVQVNNHQEGEILICDGMGILIHEEWILTAAHVARTSDPALDSILIADWQYSIKQIVLHPQWQNADVIESVKNDIALIQLNRPVADVLPLTLYSQNDETGKDIVFVGWGDFGNGLAGVEGADGRFRMATNIVEKVDEQWLVFCFDEPPNTTEMEGISGPGDSGGPALLETETGWQIAGISSTQCSAAEYSQQENWQEKEGKEGIYGVWEYYTRVSQYLEWINSIISS
ncbi:MAG: trypsin-like serine protease [Cyanobacteria bacterium J06623_7]